MGWSSATSLDSRKDTEYMRLMADTSLMLNISSMSEESKERITAWIFFTST